MSIFRNDNVEPTDLPPAPSYGLRPDLPPAPQTRLRPAPSVIGQDITITGSVSATADLQIDGRIDGDVHCGGLTTGPEGRIKGNVIAQSARLSGTIEGGVTVRNLIVAAKARITGDVAYETIAIENGAHIDGRLKYTPAGVEPSAATSAPRDKLCGLSATKAALPKQPQPENGRSAFHPVAAVPDNLQEAEKRPQRPFCCDRFSFRFRFVLLAIGRPQYRRRDSARCFRSSYAQAGLESL